MHLAQRLVRIADLNGGTFVRGRRESATKFRARMLYLHDEDDSDDSKLIRYLSAAECGAVFPPIFVVERDDGTLAVVEGFHRCCVATLRGRAAIRAVVVKVGTVEHENAVSEALFELSEGGAPWRDQLEAVAQLVAA